MSARLAGFVLAVALAAILATAGIAMFKIDSTNRADVVVAAVTAVGTLVVAFFGIHVADAGRRSAEEARLRSDRLHLFEQSRVRRLAAANTEEARAAILGEEPPTL